MAHGLDLVANAPQTLAELFEAATENRWCMRFGCTTCGARTFRKYLNGIPRDGVISGLRIMNDQTLMRLRDAFELIVMELSVFGTSSDLLEELLGTPAGRVLRQLVDRRLAAEQKRLAYRASQTPEAIAQFRVQKKERKLRERLKNLPISA